MKNNLANIIAIIPARGGSKGVPKKNIRLLYEHPLIAYSIIAAKLSKMIDRVIVSTDSQEIADIAKKYGAEVPFLRSVEFAQDKSGDIEFVMHAINWLEEKEGMVPEYFVHLRPTTPLRDPAIIDKAIIAIQNDSSATSLRSAHTAVESPLKWFSKNNNGYFVPLDIKFSSEDINQSRQSFSDTYIPNGYVDILKTSFVRKSGKMHGEKIVSFVTPFCYEVDSLEELKYIEYKLGKEGSQLLNCLNNIKQKVSIGWKFNIDPLNVPMVNTKYRKIKTSIPVPESLPLLKKLDKYESRSMHGQMPIVWDRAEDFQVFDAYGNCWIDFTSTIFVANTGHSNPKTINALMNIIKNKLLHTYTFAHSGRAEFLKKLIEITPPQFEKAFLLSAGTEATECALKLMRMNGQLLDHNKNVIISFQGAMHGRTMAAEMLRGNSTTSSWIGYKDPNMYQLSFPYPWAAKSVSNDYNWEKHFESDINRLEEEGLIFDNIAGFIIESYLGWGAIFYSKQYIQALVKFAKKYGALVAFDEIQGGFGRTGKLFVYQHYGVEPDLLCLGKALSGSLPLSAVIGSQKIMDLPDIGSMSSTHSANPLSCAAGLANLDSLIELNLIEESARKGEILHKRLNELKEKYSNRISHIFGKGLLAGIIIKDPKTGEPDSFFANEVCEKAMQKGLLLVHTGRESIKIGPPLTIPDEALNEGLNVLEECFADMSSKEER